MRRLTGLAVFGFSCAWISTGLANAQGRGGPDWTTEGGDAQRSSWLRTDPKISIESMQKPGFASIWKIKLHNDPKQLNALTPATLLTSYIGYRGFRSLAFVAGSSDNVIAIDTDLGRIEWQKTLPGAPPKSGSLDCPGGMTANVTRSTSAALPMAQAGRGGGFGRGGPAKSGVGQPGQGAVTLAETAPGRGDARGGAAFAPPAGRGAPGVPGAPGRGAPGGGGFGRTPAFVYALSSDGMLHSMYVSNGEEPEAAVKFLPANANAHGLIVVDNVAYAVTSGACGGVDNGVWALDLTSKQVANWKSNARTLGSEGPAFGPDGTLYVTTGDAVSSLVALEPKTLALKGSYAAAGQGLTASPVVFDYKGRILVAANGKDGRVHLLDGASPGGADHKTSLYQTPAEPGAADSADGLASWHDAGGARWIVAPGAGAIKAWKVADQNGAPVLQAGWVSREIAAPLAPVVVNGVIFAASSGEFRTNDSQNSLGQLSAAQRAQRSSHAVLYALDAATGKELWNSGGAITSFVHGGGLAAGGSQVYLGAYDGTLYAFGFPIEH